jgi:hypothetical protein
LLTANQYRPVIGNVYDDFRVLFTKINEGGTKEWEKTLGYASYNFLSPRIIDLQNDEYAAFWRKDWDGLPWEFQFLNVVYGMDADGEVVWEQDFSNIPFSDYKKIVSIFKTQNGDVVGMGVDQEYYEDYPQIGSGGWVFRLNNEGELLWQRNITDFRKFPDSGMYFMWGGN